MCGFIGALGTDLALDDLLLASATIAHRGPDGRQVARRGPFMLVAHRLAIVLPMVAPAIVEREDTVLALNGELYGLPRQEAGGTSTDTDALAAWFAQNVDPRSLASLRGLFAICRFDGRSLLLARDRFGIKPLYYARHGGGLVFASEMKALLALPGFSREPDPDVLSATEVFGHNVFVGATPFRHIRSLAPGHWAEATIDGVMQERAFTKGLAIPPPGEGRVIEADELSFEVERLLEVAVTRAMRHDPQRKAVFFSGGLDSTILLDMARRAGPISAWTLTDRGDADDLVEARKIASALDVPLTEEWITAEDLSREIVHYAWHFERPIVGGAFDLLGGVAFHALARKTAGENRVAFCGEGADELFMGYHRLHVAPELAAASMAERARTATPRVKEWLARRGLIGGGPSLTRSMRMLALNEGLSEYHLPSVDRSGMAFGIEVRPPYLDEDLYDLVVSLDEAVLIDREDNWTKLPLRKIMRRRVDHPGLGRVVVRRKRAMPSAVEIAGRALESQLSPLLGMSQDGGCLPALLRALFRYLHVDPGCPSVPDFTLLDFAREIRRGDGAR